MRLTTSRYVSSTTNPLMKLSRPVIVSLGMLSVLCAIAAVTMVDWNTDKLAELEPTSMGFTVLEAAGMGNVMRARALVQERQRAENAAEVAVQKAQARVNKAETKRVAISNELDSLDRAMDQESGEISKDQASEEASQDTSQDSILKAREREHESKMERRHADTSLRREKREKISLATINGEISTMSSKATKELKDAMTRKEAASKLRAIARKHLDKVAVLKAMIKDNLQSKIGSLRAQIESNEHAALRATENAKSDDAEYAKLRSQEEKHKAQAELAQKKADEAALSAENAEKEAELDAQHVSAALLEAETEKKELQSRLEEAEHPGGAITLRITTKKLGNVLGGSDVALNNNKKVDNDNDAHGRELQREIKAANDKIRQLRAAKKAAEKQAREQKQEEERLQRMLKKKKDNKKMNAAAAAKPEDQQREEDFRASRRPAPREDEDNFEASMNYLNNKHLDAATGVDDHGRDSLGRETEQGRRAYVGVMGRSPQLDAMATANLRQYEEDESELDQANYNQHDDNPLETNPF